MLTSNISESESYAFTEADKGNVRYCLYLVVNGAKSTVVGDRENWDGSQDVVF